ncbi:aldehyde dehydrogenase family 2 member C4-like protein [Tanacetum coccineum]
MRKQEYDDLRTLRRRWRMTMRMKMMMKKNKDEYDNRKDDEKTSKSRNSKELGLSFEEHIKELAALDAIDAGKVFAYGKARDVPSGAKVDKAGRDELEEAITLSKSYTPMGLAAGIATKDLNIANTVSRTIHTGIVWINCYLAFDPGCPYGGYKMSGFGREFGMEGLYKYLQVKAVVTPLHNSPWL